MAERICANSPVAVGQSLQLLDRFLGDGDDAAWGFSDDAMAAVMTSEDAREGRSAFLERRPPEWRGR